MSSDLDGAARTLRWLIRAETGVHVKEDACLRIVELLIGDAKACPRITHASGVVLECTVNHGGPDDKVHANLYHHVVWSENDDRIIAERPLRRYMMATTATHKLGDISRGRPDLACIEREEGDDYIGQWVASIVGYIEVRFPKATTRPMTDEEWDHYCAAYPWLKRG